MCGIFGTFQADGLCSLKTLESCLNKLSHRGPDGSDKWYNKQIFIGHRRLSILDLSDSGKQPMVSDNIILSVNGEVYNYLELRNILQEKHKFFSNSDSEVILHGYKEWGIDGLLKRLEGMYAFSIYDHNKKKIYLARDRVGIKPLYFSLFKKSLSWSSELKSLIQLHNLSQNDINSESLLDFLTYRYIPSPKTLYKNVYKLKPAHYFSFDTHTLKTDLINYWSLELKTKCLNEDSAIDLTKNLLVDSFKNHLISDVPIGSFLSGGVDSSLLASMIHSLHLNIPCFTIGFYDPIYDESNISRKIANHLNIENHLSTYNINSSMSLFPQMRTWFDEPFADFSSLPTYQICNFSQKKVKVALSGDGADELFGGYPRFFEFIDFNGDNSGILSSVLGKSKRFLDWNIFGRILRLVESEYILTGWDLYNFKMGGMLPNESGQFAKYLSIPNDYDRYWNYRQHWLDDSPISKVLRFIELKTSLPDALLTKVDRVSMACSLEVRVPYLSTELIEHAFSLPENMLFRNNKTKYILRKLHSHYIFNLIDNTPKKGFGIPPQLRLSSKGRRCWPQLKVLDELFNELKISTGPNP